MTKKIFVLEDDENRIETMKFFFSSYGDFEFARDITYAKERFKTDTEYDLILLDHDLGGLVYVNSYDENTGAEFCRWLVKNYHYLETPIIIHSHNPGGADNMEDTLNRSGFLNTSLIPFGHLISKWNQGVLSFLGNYKFDKG